MSSLRVEQNEVTHQVERVLEALQPLVSDDAWGELIEALCKVCGFNEMSREELNAALVESRFARFARLPSSMPNRSRAALEHSSRPAS